MAVGTIAQTHGQPWLAMGFWASKFHRTTGLLAMARHGWPMVFGLVRAMAHLPSGHNRKKELFYKRFTATHLFLGTPVAPSFNEPLKVFAKFIEVTCCLT